MFAADQRALAPCAGHVWLETRLQEVFAADQQLQRRINAQMAMPASLHRVSYRACVDPRSPLLCWLCSLQRLILTGLRGLFCVR